MHREYRSLIDPRKCRKCVYGVSVVRQWAHVRFELNPNLREQASVARFLETSEARGMKRFFRGCVRKSDLVTSAVLRLVVRQQERVTVSVSVLRDAVYPKA